MATGNSKKKIGASIVGGSEEIYDFTCQPCSTEDVYEEAIVYCQDCCEYLCDTCYRAHSKLSATKRHTMLDKSAMSKSKLRSNANDVLTDTCSKHNGKVLEYVCKGHSQICCSVCLASNHSSCSIKSYIPDISGDITNSQKYGSLKADLDNLVTIVLVQQNRIDADREDNKKMHSKTLADIKYFREENNKVLDKLEEDANQKVTSVNRANSEKIATASDKYKNLLSEVNNLKSDLTRMETGGKTNQLYVTMTMSQDRVIAWYSRISQFSMDKITTYSFNPDEKTQQMMSTLSDIWSMSFGQGDTPTSARYVRDVDVKSGDDKKDCAINSIAVLKGDRVVVTDCNNKNVKLIDMKVNQVISCLSMSSIPFDVIKTKPNQVVVALPEKRKLKIINVSDILTWSHTVRTPDSGIVGLCYDGLNFITASQHPPSVRIIDMSSRTLSTFTTDNNDKNLFNMPRYIAICHEKDVIYVTDSVTNTVTSMTSSGHVLSVYKHDMLKNPRSLAVDKDRTVYVCSMDTHTVHQLSPSGDLQILLRQEQGLACFSLGIAYNDEDHILYISSASKERGECNYIRLYQLV